MMPGDWLPEDDAARQRLERVVTALVLLVLVATVTTMVAAH